MASIAVRLPCAAARHAAVLRGGGVYLQQSKLAMQMAQACVTQLPTLFAVRNGPLELKVPPVPRKRQRRVLACSTELASVTTEQSRFRKCVRIVRAVIRALLLLVGWTPIATTGITINVLSRLKIVPQAIIDAWWSTVLWGVEMSGPAYIKLMQWASTRRDIFPENLCRRFSKFHASTKPHKWSQTVESMNISFGPDWQQHIHVADNEQNPIGSGCVAQVYKATLKTEHGDQPVAIKILHPYVKNQIEMDVDIMRAAAAVIELLPRMSWLSLRESVEEFARLMGGQLDMRVEAAALERFAANFTHDNTVSFPQANRDWTSEYVLTETLAEGR
eukprot:16636-Heterococcus_DN1.PRE.1